MSTSSEQTQNYEFDGESYVYRDKESNLSYRFDREKNEWVLQEQDGPAAGARSGGGGEAAREEGTSPPGKEPESKGVYGFENDTHTYTDVSDGSVYIWDREKNAWFPRVDEEFMARYQMSYGFVDGNEVVANEQSKQPVKPAGPLEKVKREKGSKEEKKEKRKPDPPTWFEVDNAHNTAVYVSGLPLDITREELTGFFAKCGLIARDEKGKDKVKLYKDSNGEVKGDALCIYIKVESVELALKLLDNSEIRGKTVSVQRAKFQMKGEYDPALKPKRKKKEKERQKKIRQKLFDWRPERLFDEPQKCERVVIIKNLFSPEDFEKEVQLLLEYQQDIRSECSKCGDVRKVVIYDRHPDGVAQVTFREPAEAQACVELLNGRWFSQRRISAEIWDGKTKYKITETDEQIEARLAKWDKYLEDEEEEKLHQQQQQRRHHAAAQKLDGQEEGRKPEKPGEAGKRMEDAEI